MLKPGRNGWSIKNEWNCDTNYFILLIRTYKLYSDCGNPMTISQGKVNFTDTLLDSLAMYTCRTGYDLVGDNMTQCGEDGRWIWTYMPDCLIVGKLYR